MLISLLLISTSFLHGAWRCVAGCAVAVNALRAKRYGL
jgi:hypothetical protein